MVNYLLSTEAKQEFLFSQQWYPQYANIVLYIKLCHKNFKKWTADSVNV